MTHAEPRHVQGVPLVVLDTGSGGPILVLHGELGFTPNETFLSLLAGHRRVIAPVHPGFGHSIDVETIDTIDDLSYLYLDLLDELNLRDVVVVGVSLGGWVAAEMAVKCSDRLAKIVLVSPTGIKVGDRETRDIPDIFALSPDAVARLQYHDPSLAEVDYTRLSDAELSVIARNREATALYVWEPYFHNPKLLQRLHRIRVPTLLVWGASDRFLIPEYYGAAYRDAIPGARLELIEQAGHWPHVEQPDTLVEHIRRFLG